MKLTKDQKRAKKIKAAKKKAVASVQSGLAYHGKKYKSPEFSPLFFEIESGVHSYCETHPELSDPQIDRAYRAEIAHLKGEATNIQDDENTIRELVDIIHSNISAYVVDQPLPKQAIIGVLRTLLGSMSDYRNEDKRGYLSFLEEFIHQGPSKPHVHTASCNH